MKKYLIFFGVAFLYLFLSSFVVYDAIGKLYIQNFGGVNFGLLLIIILILSIILLGLYIKFHYYIDQYIYKLRFLIVFIPIIIIGTTLVLTGMARQKLETYNNNVLKDFESNEIYLDLSKDINGLVFRLNKNNDLIEIDEEDGKYKIKTYEKLTFEKAKFNEFSKFRVYELDDGYIFAYADKEKKNYYVKDLNKESYFYQLNIDTSKLQEYKNIELKVITKKEQEKYDLKVINEKVYASKQTSQNYNVYRQYFHEFYFLFKTFNLKTAIKQKYPNYKSASYSNDYSNVTVGNDVIKVYARINELFELELYEDEKD